MTEHNCPHMLHLEVDAADKAVHIDIDPDRPVLEQIEGISAAIEGLLIIRAQCVELHRMRN
jgi:hypothetical protein